jgi:hypothetical protein
MANKMRTLSHMEMTPQEALNVINDIRQAIESPVAANWQLAECINNDFWWNATHEPRHVWAALHDTLKRGSDHDVAPRLQLAIMLDELEKWLDE